MKHETNANDALRFLRALFKPYNEGYVEIRSISKRKNYSVQQNWYRLPDAFSGRNSLEIGQYITSLAERGYDVYVGVNPRDNNTEQGLVKAGKNAVSRIAYCWLDMDNKVPNADPALINDWDIIIDTGNGWHGYKALPTIKVCTSLKDKADIEAKVRAIAQSVLPNTDNVSDLPRILRIPGTLNWKSDVPKPVRLLKCPGDPVLKTRSKWSPLFNDPRLDGLLVSAYANQLGRAVPRIMHPTGRHIDCLDTAVVGLYETFIRSKKDPQFKFAEQMARQDLPLIMRYFFGDNHGLV
jgi:hypothetical protein